MGWWNESLVVGSRSHDQDGRDAHMLKPFKNLLLQNQWADCNKTWHVVFRAPVYHGLFKLLTLFDLDLFYAKVKFCRLGFCMGKGENYLFSKIVPAYDLKEINKEMKLHDYQRPRSSFDLGQRLFRFQN